MPKRKRTKRPDEVKLYVTRVPTRADLSNVLHGLPVVIEKPRHPFGNMGWTYAFVAPEYARDAVSLIIGGGYGVEVARGSPALPTSPQQQPPPQQHLQSTSSPRSPGIIIASQKSPIMARRFPESAGGDSRTEGSQRSSGDSQYGPSLRPQTEGSWGKGTLQQQQSQGGAYRPLHPPSHTAGPAAPAATAGPSHACNYPENRARLLDKRQTSIISEEAVACGAMVSDDESSPSEDDERGYDPIDSNEDEGRRQWNQANARPSSSNTNENQRQWQAQPSATRQHIPFDYRSSPPPSLSTPVYRPHMRVDVQPQTPQQQQGLAHLRPDIADEEERRRQQSAPTTAEPRKWRKDQSGAVYSPRGKKFTDKQTLGEHLAIHHPQIDIQDFTPFTPTYRFVFCDGEDEPTFGHSFKNGITSPCRSPHCRQCHRVADVAHQRAMQKKIGHMVPWPRLPCTCDTEGAVYVLGCRKCGTVYIGETSQAVRKRICSHVTAIDNQTDNLPSHSHDHHRQNVDNLTFMVVAVEQDKQLRQQYESTLIRSLGMLNVKGII